MRNKKIAVIHYMPVEMYPPVMNLVRTWDKINASIRLTVYTTAAHKQLSRFQPVSELTTITRLGVSGRKRSMPVRLLHYLYYYLATFFRLLGTRPESVLYYDSISSFPAILYKIFFPETRLLVHYNEYMSPAEYNNGMFLLRWFHKMEKKIYPGTSWLSHTNQERMDLFLADIRDVQVPFTCILPNFPPADWKRTTAHDMGWPLKCVYTGALSLDTMYTQLFAEWVLKQEGRVTWDIYSTNVTAEATAFIQSLPAAFIRMHNGINYYALPSVLQAYHVGVILYNGHIPNYVFNAPNKLFEYAALGLDVWFPNHMQSSCRYITAGRYPKIVALDFQHLDKIDIDSLISRKDHTFQAHPFACETVLLPLLNKLAG
jgi:hypothetical protein